MAGAKSEPRCSPVVFCWATFSAGVNGLSLIVSKEVSNKVLSTTITLVSTTIFGNVSRTETEVVSVVCGPMSVRDLVERAVEHAAKLLSQKRARQNHKNRITSPNKN